MGNPVQALESHDRPVLPVLPAALDDLPRLVWRRKYWIASSLVVGLAAGALFYLKCPRAYESEAQVLVLKRRPEVVVDQGRNTAPIEDNAATHRILMQSPTVVERAIREGKLDKLQCFANEKRDLTEALGKAISVSSVLKESTGDMNTVNSVLRISFRGAVASECATVVDALVNSYRGFLEETYQTVSYDTVKLITEARGVLERDLERKEAAYREFRERSPMVWRGKDEVNPRQDRLAAIESQRAVILLRKADLKGQSVTIENMQKSGSSDEELAALVVRLARKSNERESGERAAEDPLKSHLAPLLMDEENLRELLGPQHPQVLAMRQRIEALRNLYALPAGVQTESPPGADSSGRLDHRDLVDRYCRYLRQELEVVEGSERVLANLFDEEHRAARELNAYEIREAELRNDVARTQALYDGIVKRVQEASLLKEYGGFEARIIAPPRLGKKVFPSAATTGAVSLCLGLLGGLGLACLVEAGASKRRLQAERRGSAWKVIGQLPPFVPSMGESSAMSSSSNLDPLLFVHHQPRSPAANACRAVRNAVLAEAADTGHKVLQITSPRDGDGVSVVAANLAIALAQAGRKTLLLDADLLQPQQHRNFGLPEGPGLTSILSESAEIADAVLDSGIRNLWVLPFGPLVRDARQLLAARRFHELFSLFRDQYDCILVDTPSLQTATEASLVTPWVDAVLLIVRADEQATQDAEQTSQVLAALGVEVLGAVVNCAAGGLDSSGEPVLHEGSRRKGAVSGQPEVPAQQIET